VPRYVCTGGRGERGASACRTIGGLRVDQAVAAAVLEAIQPAGVQASLDALERVMTAHDIKRQALALALEKAHYEGQRARRQYDRVAPDSRLVAGELARRWNEELERVVEVEAHLAALSSHQGTLNDEQRQRFRSLGQDLSAVWHHPAAPEALKKRLLRTVLYEMIIDTTQEPPEHTLHLHWPGGGHTTFRVARTTPGTHGRATDHHVIARMRELSKVCRDLTTAATLKRWGDRTGTGQTWRVHRVARVRYP
jgi:hypothetical protein